jgi:tRNA(His) 5'-end guanylyltransferase
MEDQFKELRDYIDERTRDMETHLLTEFRKWALRIEANIKPQPLEERTKGNQQ